MRRWRRAKLPVLVTGGAGYIGSHAVLALLDAGWPVVVIDNLVTGFRLGGAGRRRPSSRATSPIRPLLARLIAEHRIGAIMHFAGSVVVPESVENPLKYYENNTVKSRALIESAVKGGVRHFIFSSTAATYGIPDAVPVAEGAPTEPINPYGWSKLMTERMLNDAAAAHPLNYCAPCAISTSPAPIRRAAPASRPRARPISSRSRSRRRSASAAMSTSTAPTIETPDGTGVRDYIHVTDLAAAHVLALERLIADPARATS